LKTVETGGLFGLINLFSGGALIQLSVFALGIMPYITSSIIVQLLTVVIPRFEALKQEGQSGTAKLTQYTRYLTIGLAILQSTGLIAVARTPGRLLAGCDLAIIPDTSWQRIVTMIFVMTAGTSVIMWLGELITDRGVGNGMSILIFTSIAASFPSQLWSISAKGLVCFHLRDVGRYFGCCSRCVRGASSASYSSSICQAHGWTSGIRWNKHIHSNQG
jgi:preprotein translocase subunit SecY